MGALIVIKQSYSWVIVQSRILHNVQWILGELVRFRIVNGLVHDTLARWSNCFCYLAPYFRVLTEFISFFEFIDPRLFSNLMTSCEHRGVIHIVEHVRCLPWWQKSGQVIDVPLSFSYRSFHILGVQTLLVRWLNQDVHPRGFSSCLCVKIEILVVVLNKPLRLSHSGLNFEGRLRLVVEINGVSSLTVIERINVH